MHFRALCRTNFLLIPPTDMLHMPDLLPTAPSQDTLRLKELHIPLDIQNSVDFNVVAVSFLWLNSCISGISGLHVYLLWHTIPRTHSTIDIRNAAMWDDSERGAWAWDGVGEEGPWVSVG